MSASNIRAVGLADKIVKKWRSGPQAVAKQIAQCIMLERGYGLVEGMEFTIGALKKALDKRQEGLTPEQLQPLVEIMQELDIQAKALRGISVSRGGDASEPQTVAEAEVVETVTETAKVINE